MQDEGIHKAEQRIRCAYVALAKSSPKGSVSVSAVCREAGVSRTTFYSYYQSVDTLRSSIEYEVMLEGRRIFRDFEYLDLDRVLSRSRPIPMFEQVYDYVYRNWDVFQLLVAESDDDAFRSEWGSQIETTLLARLDEGFDPKDVPLVTSLCRGCFEGLTWDWFSGRIDATPRQMAEATTKAFAGVLRAFRVSGQPKFPVTRN